MLPAQDEIIDANQPQQAPQRPRSPISQHFNDLWTIFSKDLRKKFHVYSDLIYKLETTKARLKYLENCLAKKHIPPSLKVKRSCTQKLSEKGKKQWENNLKTTEICNLRIFIKEVKNDELSLSQKVSVAKWNFFGLLLQEEQIIVERELEKRKKKFGERETERFRNKLKFQQSKVTQENLGTHTQEIDRDGETKDKKKKRRFIKRSRYRRIIKKLSKKELKPIFTNYSDHELTISEQNLLNKHSSFVPLPKKVNKTQLIYDTKRLERNLRWNEYYASEEGQKGEKLQKIFSVKKHNLPDQPASRTLNNFMYGIESELITIPKKKIVDNLTIGERNSLQNLIEKQKSGEIVIQKTDKGGGIAIMNRGDYIEKIEREHLQSLVTMTDGRKKEVYREVDRTAMKLHHFLIKGTVKDALEEKLIDEETAKILVPDVPREGRAYGMVKAHKETPEGEKLPPMRLVISGCGSTTENISHFIDHFAKDIPPKLESHIQDTPHLLRILDTLNNESTQPENAILVTIDVVGLYPNIPQDEGMAAFREHISDPNLRDQSMPSDFLMTLLRYVLSFNSFSFNEKLYLQCWGTAIGTKVAPTYSNIFMANLEKMFLSDWKGTSPKLWKRFLDDVISVWYGEKAELIAFIKFLNEYHPTIKFTAEFRTKEHQIKMKYVNGEHIISELPLGTLKPRSIDFLDTTISIDSTGKFVTDLFQKSSDRVTYLLPSSSHPGHICRNIPYSLGYRLKRICSSEADYKVRLDELSSNLLSRGYCNKVIKSAFQRLNQISREQALQKVSKTKKNNTTFTLTYDPRMNSPSEIVKRHYMIASNDPSFRKNFPEIPRIAFRRSRNLGELLMRSKLYEVNENRHSDREDVGFTRCNSRDFGCKLCLHSENAKQHKSSQKGKIYEIKSKIRCTDDFVIYSIQCKKCPNVQYVGQTSQTIRNRFYGHFQDIRANNQSKPVARHFNSRGHTENDIVFTPFEKLRAKDKTMLNVREKYWINEKQPNINILY